MNEVELLALYDRYQRIQVEEAGMRRSEDPEAIRQVSVAPGQGRVVYCRMEADRADAVIEAQIAFFEALGQDFEWKHFGHDRPADLKQRLLARGFAAEEPESLLVAEIEQAPPCLLEPVRHEVRRLTDPAGLAAIGSILDSVWGDDSTSHLAALADTLVQDPDHVSVYLAYADGVPVAYSRIIFYDHSPFADLCGGSTLAGHRGQGHYTAMLAMRLQEARARGIRFLAIDASPMSLPIVRKHGFQYLTSTQPFIWKAGR